MLLIRTVGGGAGVGIAPKTGGEVVVLLPLYVVVEFPATIGVGGVGTKIGPDVELLVVVLVPLDDVEFTATGGAVGRLAAATSPT